MFRETHGSELGSMKGRSMNLLVGSHLPKPAKQEMTKIGQSNAIPCDTPQPFKDRVFQITLS